jgi:hypothetical protein
VRYFRPTSLTWWAGVFAVATGVALLATPKTAAVTEFGRLIALLAGSGDTSPAGLIALGLGLIGLRDRLERGFRGDS